MGEQNSEDTSRLTSSFYKCKQQVFSRKLQQEWLPY